jgi:hypothetical protein
MLKCKELTLLIIHIALPEMKSIFSILYIKWANIWISFHQRLVKSNSNFVLSRSAEIIVKIKMTSQGWKLGTEKEKERQYEFLRP